MPVRSNGVSQASANGTTRLQKKEEVPRKLKSTLVAYFFWLFGGIFGAHHLYLGRVDHAIVFATTLGGYFGLGCFRDLWRIPSYVKDANDDPNYVEMWKLIVRQNKKPPFSTFRFIGGIAAAHVWGELIRNAIPEEELYGINFRPLLLLVPGAVAAGVWTVGNIGRERGSIWLPLLTAYVMYPLLYYIGDQDMWLHLTAIVTGLVFDTFSKEWRLTPKRKRSAVRQISLYTFSVLLFAALTSSYFYFNATLTNSDGEEIKFTEAVRHFFTSPIWLDVKSALWQVWEQSKQQGFWETWRHVVDLSDPTGQINAYRVLGLSATASESEITSKWRTLSKEHHPDKVHGTDEERKAAQDRFMEIQQAYEILSKKKSKRQRRNERGR